MNQDQQEQESPSAGFAELKAGNRRVEALYLARIFQTISLLGLDHGDTREM